MSEWLDIFLEYALCLARNGQSKEAYEICEAAKDSVVWCHIEDDRFLIHMSWCSESSYKAIFSHLLTVFLACALLAGDDTTLLVMARHFLKDYQFVTDAYRMFSTFARMCHSPLNYYADPANQKFMLRQIKFMDYALVDQERRDSAQFEKASYFTKDKDGEFIINDDMDIALIMLYGNILYASQSYTQALSKCPLCHLQICGNLLEITRLLLSSLCPGSQQPNDQLKPWS